MGLQDNTSATDNTLRGYGQTTFVPVASYPIPGVSGVSGSLVRWGDAGLAFRKGNWILLVEFSF